jgi:hypothetical protein
VADASQFAESSFIQLYSIIWKWGFKLLVLQGWQTLTHQDEIHSLKMVVLKLAATFKYMNKQ